MSYNRVILVGNLTRDPELSYTPSKVAICKFSIAVNRKWKDRDGNAQEEVSYVDLTAFNRTAEVIAEHMTKGRQILAEGRLKQDRWADKDGKNRNKIGVVVDSFQFVGGREEESDQGHRRPRTSETQPRNEEKPPPDVPYPGDDIPF